MLLFLSGRSRLELNTVNEGVLNEYSPFHLYLSVVLSLVSPRSFLLAVILFLAPFLSG